jgi:hypothetical protein
MMAGIRLRVIANDKSEITSQNTCQLNFESPNRFPGKAPGPGSRFWGGEYLIRKYYVKGTSKNSKNDIGIKKGDEWGR